MDRLDTLAFFIRIIEKGGVAAAGRDFSLSAQTASDRLAALEAHYGATLLTRTTRSISLTEEGKLLLESAKHLVSEAQDIEARITHGVTQLSGLIRLSAPLDLGLNHIRPLVDSFIAAHPTIEIDLTLSDEHSDLVGRGIDLAVRLGALKDSSLMVKRIGDNTRHVCAAPSYLKAHGTPETPAELTDHNCLIMRFGTVIDRDWRFKVKGRERSVTVHGNLTSNNGALIHDWCREGQGLALKSIWDVGADIASGRLVAVLEDFRPATRSQLQLVYPGGGKPNRRVRALMDHLTAHLNASVIQSA